MTAACDLAVSDPALGPARPAPPRSGPLRRLRGRCPPTANAPAHPEPGHRSVARHHRDAADQPQPVEGLDAAALALCRRRLWPPLRGLSRATRRASHDATDPTHGPLVSRAPPRLLMGGSAPSLHRSPHRRASPCLPPQAHATALARSGATAHEAGRSLFDQGLGGPGGWILLQEVDVKLGQEDRGPGHRRLAPRPHAQGGPAPGPSPWRDWVCEVIPREPRPSIAGTRPTGTRRQAWGGSGSPTPKPQTLEVYENDGGQFRQRLRFQGSASVAAPPFDAVAWPLASLWRSKTSKKHKRPGMAFVEGAAGRPPGGRGRGSRSILQSPRGRPHPAPWPCGRLALLRPLASCLPRRGPKARPSPAAGHQPPAKA